MEKALLKLPELIDFYKRGEWSRVQNPLPDPLPKESEAYNNAMTEAGFAHFEFFGDRDIEIRVNRKMDYWLVSIRSQNFLVADFPSLLMLMSMLGQWVDALRSTS